MTNAVDRKHNILDRAAGENCILEEEAIESVQNEAYTTPIYTKSNTVQSINFCPLRMQPWLHI